MNIVEYIFKKVYKMDKLPSINNPRITDKDWLKARKVIK
jgi:hypothetical protein